VMEEFQQACARLFHLLVTRLHRRFQIRFLFFTEIRYFSYFTNLRS
jgi:hypothetical protein